MTPLRGHNFDETYIDTAFSSTLLQRCLSNEEKSVWEPCQTITWLAIVWNSGNGTIAISERRLEKISATIGSIIDLDFVVSAPKLASFTGQFISTGTIIGNIARIMTRHCVMSTVCAQHWDAAVELDQYSKEQIIF